MDKDELISLIEQNADIMKILTIISALGLREGCLCAGTIRNYVWSYLTDNLELIEMTDIDVIFFDKGYSYEATCQLENELNQTYPEYRWEVRNQAFMHSHNPDTEAYVSVEDALSKFPETCTALALRKNAEAIELIAPWGIEDLIELLVKPTPHFSGNEKRMEIYRKRVVTKNWQASFPELQIEWYKK